MSDERTIIYRPCKFCKHDCDGVFCTICKRHQRPSLLDIFDVPYKDDIPLNEVMLRGPKQASLLKDLLPPDSKIVIPIPKTPEQQLAEKDEEINKLRAQLKQLSEHIMMHYPRGWAFDGGNLPLMVDNIVRFMEQKIAGAQEGMERAKLELGKAQNKLFEAL